MTVKIGRLAMREEGGMWNAYYAMPDTMKDALHLGGIRMALIASNTPRKEVFMDMMRDAIADIIEEQTGLRPTFPKGPQPAPESERGGSA